MSLFNIRKSVVVSCLVLLLPVSLCAQKKSPSPSIKRIPMTAEYWEFQPGKAEFVQHKNVPAMKLQRDAGLAIVKNLDFTNGTIEFDAEPLDARPYLLCRVIFDFK